MILVIGMNYGVRAENSVDVSINIDKYAEFDLDSVNIEIPNGVNPKEDDIERIIGTIKANYDFKIFVDSEGLTSEDNNLNDKVEYAVSNGPHPSWNYETFRPGSDSGHAFNFAKSERSTSLWLRIDFKDKYNWEEFTAGDYSDTLTITISAE